MAPAQQRRESSAKVLLQAAARTHVGELRTERRGQFIDKAAGISEMNEQQMSVKCLESIIPYSNMRSNKG